MSDLAIQPKTNDTTALSAEHYQTFEMAKANDGIIGGDNIAQIRSYSAFTRAQAQAMQKSIASMNDIDDVAASKSEMTENMQTYAKVSVFCDQRIGEILRELPKGKGNQYTSASLPVGNEATKTEAIENAGMSKKTASQLEKLAEHPDVVEAVIARAEAEGRVVSRNQVLKAINEQKRAERERDEARRELKKASIAQTNLEMEAASLRQRSDEAERERDEARSDLEDAYLANERMEDEIAALRQEAQAKPQPEIIEREIVHEVVPDRIKQQLKRYESESEQHAKEYESLRHRYESVRSELKNARKEVSESREREYPLLQALRELKAIKYKYEDVHELADVFAAIEALEDNVA